MIWDIVIINTTGTDRTFASGLINRGPLLALLHLPNRTHIRWLIHLQMSICMDLQRERRIIVIFLHLSTFDLELLP